jgi:hypothetical protein
MFKFGKTQRHKMAPEQMMDIVDMAIQVGGAREGQPFGLEV